MGLGPEGYKRPQGIPPALPLLSAAHMPGRVAIATSSDKMWPEDIQDSQSAMHQYDNGEGSSSYAASPSTNSSTATQCEPLMDMDDELGAFHDRDQPLPSFNQVSTASNHPFLDDYMSEIYGDDGDDDEHDDGGAPIDILSITNVLSHGLMGLDDGAESATSNMTDAGHGGSESAFVSDHHPPNPSTLPYSLQDIPFAGLHHPQQNPPPPFIHLSTAHHINTGATAPAPQATPQGDQPNNSNNHHVQLFHHPQVLHQNAVGNPNATALGPENYCLADFVRVWAWQAGAWHNLSRERGRYPWPNTIQRQFSHELDHVDYMDLEGDRCDVQGLDWEELGVTRNEARERRLNTYKNYVNIANSDRWQVRRFSRTERLVAGH